MKQELDIEQQLWDFLDGLCDESDARRIAQLVETNAAWQAKLIEVKASRNALLQHMEQEEPSLRFTQNVMDLIGHEQVAPRAKYYLNRPLIAVIAGFFIAVVAGILIELWSSEPIGQQRIYFWNKIDITAVGAGNFDLKTFLFGFLVLNIIAALLLLDAAWRKWRKSPLT